MGRTLATISDETSVKRLVKPSAQTVGLIRCSHPRASRSDADPGARFRARPRIAVQSIEYMNGPCDPGALPAILSTSEIVLFSAANGVLTVCFVDRARNYYVPGP